MIKTNKYELMECEVPVVPEEMVKLYMSLLIQKHNLDAFIEYIDGNKNNRIILLERMDGSSDHQYVVCSDGNKVSTGAIKHIRQLIEELKIDMSKKYIMLLVDGYCENGPLSYDTKEEMLDACFEEDVVDRIINSEDPFAMYDYIEMTTMFISIKSEGLNLILDIDKK
ncbi:MAG: hypothetical protein ACRC23_02055 [Aeromonas jandaei]